MPTQQQTPMTPNEPPRPFFFPPDAPYHALSRETAFSSWTKFSTSTQPVAVGTLKASTLWKAEVLLPSYDPPRGEWQDLRAEPRKKPRVRPDNSTPLEEPAGEMVESPYTVADEQTKYIDNAQSESMLEFKRLPVKEAILVSDLTQSLQEGEDEGSKD